MTKEELLMAMEELIAAAKNESEGLSKDNADIINLGDVYEIQALLEHWGHKVVVYHGSGRNSKYSYIYSIDGDKEKTKAHAVKIINQHLDENGIVKI